MTSLSYESSGVDYDQLDAFKRACQRAARTTAPLLAAHGYAEPAATRGESCYLIEAADHYLAHVEEGLGTKNLVADAVYAQQGLNFYREIAIDTVATIVNDLVTCGALPVSVAMHAAVGDSQWFADAARMQALVEGWAEGCRQAGAVWGGGETPTLKGIVAPEAIVLAGSAIGRIAPKSLRITGDVREGDAILFLASSGVQTNGLSLCRLIAERLPQGYATPLGHGAAGTYGEALLAPSVIYVNFVAECQRRGLKLGYVSHVTGHGWRKLMRLEEPFVYEITELRTSPPVFRFLQEMGPISQREMYATYNMGVGFAAYVAPELAEATLAAARDSGYDAWLAGTVKKEGSRKAVTVPPLNLSFEADTLQVR
ncbi:phosphoribosylformylglycinamidine cyclo-ligase [Cephaloticoccus primus]|uniref:Phosphoribosylformylglycinamidine cyclo-ligase n=1 Tax=Cephaloticoccus primus TaxID=1548207 RepID=A0A139SLL1_9BACT|nr:AIR synthase related protein [Cephaloticoccus primus]KXU35438.1 phosphoribosylformylglycinamidine cyclo-ligase [Cephaloticoccus primus]